MTMKKLFPIVATLIVLAISGCAPRVDMAAEEAAIREMNVEWVNAANAKDVERMLGLYTDDASLYRPNLAIVNGKEAIRTHYSQVVESPGFVISAETTNVGISSAGDLAYSAGTSEETINDPDGNPVTERGKWVSILKKQPDGTWKSVLDIWNSDGPPASE
jgi:uncharacterized protein (TIGR02246 family)